MRFCAFSLPVLVWMFGFLGDTRGACGPGGCGRYEVIASEEWRPYAGEPGRFAHYLGGVQVGGYDANLKIYRAYDVTTDTWGPPQRLSSKKHSCACVAGCYCGDECPCSGGKRCTDDCTCVARNGAEQAIPNYGVDLSRLSGKHEEVVTLNGHKIPKHRAHEILSGQLQDDSGKLRLTAIGGPERKQLLDDLEKPPLNEWKDRLLVQSYPLDHWAVTRAGFFTGGRPTIYLQAPDGKVLHRQDDYADGANGLAEAIRRADPAYDPKKDPDLRKLLRFPDPLTRMPPAAWLLGAGVLYGLFMKGQP